MGHPVLILHLTSSKINLAFFQLMVFAVTFQGRILGVMIKQDGTLNSKSYIRHVKINCIPQMKAVNGGSLDGATWQQDGASIHSNPNFLNYLDREFEGRVLAKGAECDGRRGHCWAPRSPDLTVCDFALWPILKRRVYLSPRPRTLDELEERILNEIDEINRDPDLIKTCHLSVRKRAQLYVQNNGGHFEMFR